jgi:hypothetical protein
VIGLRSEHKTLRRSSLLSWTGLALSALLSFEYISKVLLESWIQQSRWAIDSGFWAMGISALALFSFSLLTARQLLDSKFLSEHKSREFFLPAASFLLFFLVQLFRRPFALPFWDDYYGYFEWQLHKGAMSGLPAALSAFFETYLECKTAVSRMLAELFRLVTGSGFVLITKLLNLLILGTIAWMIASEQQKGERRKLLFWISGILLFNLQQFYNILCAFSGTTYYIVVLLALLAFRYRRRTDAGGFAMTLAFATAAAFTFGNGWIVFPMIVAGYLIERRYSAFVISLLIFATVAALYFSDYHPERLNPVDRFQLTQFLLYGFSFLGGHLQFHDVYLLPFLSAAVVLSVLFFGIMKNGLRSVQYLSLNLLIFLTGTAFLAALFRHQNGFQQSLSLRYGFFSVVALAAAISFLVGRMNDSAFKSHGKTLLALSIGITAFKTLFFYPEMAVAQTENHRMIRNWLLTGAMIEKRTAFYPEGTTELLEKSEKAGLWQRIPFDTTAVNSTLFTIGYITPGSYQQEPVD